MPGSTTRRREAAHGSNGGRHGRRGGGSCSPTTRPAAGGAGPQRGCCTTSQIASASTTAYCCGAPWSNSLIPSSVGALVGRLPVLASAIDGTRRQSCSCHVQHAFQAPARQTGVSTQLQFCEVAHCVLRRFNCVAVTDQLVHQRVAADAYQKCCGELETCVRTLASGPRLCGVQPCESPELA